MAGSDYISPLAAQTLYGLFCERLKRSPDKPAYGYFDNTQQCWLELSWQHVAENVYNWQQALQQENLRRGDRIALNLRNSKEWIFCDLAALSLGLVVVPLYPEDRPDNVAYILQDADARLLLLNNRKQWTTLKAILPEEYHLHRVIVLNNDESETTATDPHLLSLDNWLDCPDVEVSIIPTEPDKL